MWWEKGNPYELPWDWYIYLHENPKKSTKSRYILNIPYLNPMGKKSKMHYVLQKKRRF